MRTVSSQEPANSRNEKSASPIGGAAITMASVIPVRTVMKGGIGPPGLTKVWNSPMISPPRIFTAPISVMESDWAEPPVVSRSTTTKVVSINARPRSSKPGCQCDSLPTRRKYGAAMTLPGYPSKVALCLLKVRRLGICRTSMPRAVEETKM